MSGNSNKPSIAEQINFGRNYENSRSNGPGMVDYLKSLFDSDGGSEYQRIEKKSKPKPTLQPKK